MLTWLATTNNIVDWHHHHHSFLHHHNGDVLATTTHHKHVNTMEHRCCRGQNGWTKVRPKYLLFSLSTNLRQTSVPSTSTTHPLHHSKCSVEVFHAHPQLLLSCFEWSRSSLPTNTPSIAPNATWRDPQPLLSHFGREKGFLPTNHPLNHLKHNAEGFHAHPQLLLLRFEWRKGFLPTRGDFPPSTPLQCVEMQEGGICALPLVLQHDRGVFPPSTEYMSPAPVFGGNFW